MGRKPLNEKKTRKSGLCQTPGARALTALAPSKLEGNVPDQREKDTSQNA